jgi:arsenate reductase
MKKIYYLESCSTCKRIIKDLSLKQKGFEFREIKSQPLSLNELEHLKSIAGSYEALFSKTALKYRTLETKPVEENEFKDLIMDEYTFLKRPVILLGNDIYIGSKQTTLADVNKRLKNPS